MREIFSPIPKINCNITILMSKSQAFKFAIAKKGAKSKTHFFYSLYIRILNSMTKSRNCEKRGEIKFIVVK